MRRVICLVLAFLPFLAVAGSAAAAQKGKAPAGGSADPTEWGFKKEGTDAWRSPGGLLYSGKDPQGRTRIEHVLEHTRNNPKRPGAHGVYAGGPATAFKVIDEAWALAKKGGSKVTKQVQGNRTVYTVNLGRKIGYVGGKEGELKKNPPARRVRLVIEGKDRVITAFPLA